MKISKYEGIKLLAQLNLPTVKLMNMQQLLDRELPIPFEEGLSIRLSPRSKFVKWSVGLPSINRRTDLEEIRKFYEQYKDKYIVFAHKSFRPESIGTLSKLKDALVMETYQSYEDKYDEIIDNRVIVPIMGERLMISKMEMARKDEKDFKNFRKVLMHLKGIPFSEYEMEFVIQDKEPLFTDFTVSESRELKIYNDLYGEREL